jgi:hypothetical protein
MDLQNFQNDGVVVKRTTNAQAQTPTNVDYEGYLDGIYVSPVSPFSVPSFSGALWVLGIIEYTLLGFALVMGILFIFFIAKLRGKYRCPKCGMTYCWHKKVPETCKRCGTKLGIPQINLPK